MLFQSQCFTNLVHRVLSLPGNEVGVSLQSNVTFSYILYKVFMRSQV